MAARESSRVVGESEPLGFDYQVSSLRKELLRPGDDDSLKTIGVIGMAGTGKTTLCQLIFDDKKVKSFFVPRIWVCMSKRSDESDDEIVAVHKRMLVCLGVEKEIIHDVYDKYRLKGLSQALHLQLAGKRYLIVLDDAWDSSSPREGKWEELACGLPQACGGAVIVTSRNEKLAKTIIGREGILHRVPALSEELCWSLFKRELGEAKNRVQKEIEEEKKRLEKESGVPKDRLEKEFEEAKKSLEKGFEEVRKWLEKEKEKKIVDARDQATLENNKQIEESRNLKRKILEMSAGIPLAAKLLAKNSTKNWVQKWMGKYVKDVPTDQEVSSDKNMLLNSFLASFDVVSKPSLSSN